MRSLNVPAEAARSFVLYVTKGLADVAEEELTELASGVSVIERSERFLVANMTPGDSERVGASARTVDDLRMVVAGPTRVQDQRDIGRLCAAAAAEIEAAVDLSDTDPSDPWSVTLSARNPPWRRKPRWDPAPVISRNLHRAELSGTTRSPVDVRIQVDEDVAHIAVNLWDRAIGKQVSELATTWHGALRSTVAASLVRLAASRCSLPERATGVYDPFCGSGTIVAEATRADLPVFASDQSEDAVEHTRARLGELGVPPDRLLQHVFRRDVRRGPDQRVTARMLVGNMPWGKQVKVDGRLALFDATSLLVAHTVQSGGVAVLLTTHEEQLLPRLRRHGLQATARRIGLLGQTPAIVTAQLG